MLKRRNKKTVIQLANVEFELMNIMWTRGPGTVRDVLNALPPERKLAYTSVSTVLRILESKGAVRAQKEGQSHIYEPRFTRAEYEAFAVKNFVATVFNDVPRALVARLIDATDLSSQDIAHLRDMLDERFEKGP